MRISMIEATPPPCGILFNFQGLHSQLPYKAKFPNRTQKIKNRDPPYFPFDTTLELSLLATNETLSSGFSALEGARHLQGIEVSINGAGDLVRGA